MLKTAKKELRKAKSMFKMANREYANAMTKGDEAKTSLLKVDLGKKKRVLARKKKGYDTRKRWVKRAKRTERKKKRVFKMRKRQLDKLK